MFHGKKFLSVPEAAARLGVTRLTVYRWVRGTRRTPKGIRLRDVIRDTRNGHAYIPEPTIRDLRKALRGR